MKQDIPWLAICVPTYNRCEMTVDCVLDTIRKTDKYKFPIIVTDNASTDGTQQAIEKLKEQYPQIIYHRNDENLGADRNFETCLKMSPAQYSWLLGDSYRIVEKELETIIAVLEVQQPCALITNGFDRMQAHPSRSYDKPEELLYDLGWHMTMMSCLIFSRDLLHNTNFGRYYNTNFIQDGIIFEYFNSHPTAKVYWLDINSNTGSTIKKETWINRRFEIFGIAWTEYILSLPYGISLATKLKCIREHNDKTKLFTFWTALKMRRDGLYDVQKLKKCRQHIALFWGTPYWVAYIAAIFPKFVLGWFSDRSIKGIKRVIRRKKQK